MTVDDVIRLINIEIYENGSQRQAAIQMGISEQYLSDVLKRTREPGKKILKALKLRRVVSYEKECGE